MLAFIYWMQDYSDTLRNYTLSARFNKMVSTSNKETWIVLSEQQVVESSDVSGKEQSLTDSHSDNEQMEGGVGDRNFELKDVKL